MRVKFIGSKVTTDAGLIAYREIDKTLELTGMGLEMLTVSRHVVAKVERRAKYVTFQLAEVAITRKLFAAILDRVERLALPLPDINRVAA